MEVESGAECALAFTEPVAGTDAARFPGVWSAVFVGPDGPLARAAFEIEERAP